MKLKPFIGILAISGLWILSGCSSSDGISAPKRAASPDSSGEAYEPVPSSPAADAPVAASPPRSASAAGPAKESTSFSRDSAPTEATPSLSAPAKAEMAASDKGVAAPDSSVYSEVKKQKVPIQSGTLTAGDIDDNLNFTAFQQYLNKQLQADKAQILPSFGVANRVTLQIVDTAGRGVSHARVRISDTNMTKRFLETVAGSDGRCHLFPAFDGLNNPKLDLQVMSPDAVSNPQAIPFKTTLDLQQLNQERLLTVTLPKIVAKKPKALDIMLVIDTTGSMSDELRYLTTELRDIIGAVQNRHSKQIAIRFGLVVYRDQGDEYVVRFFKFTDSLNQMQTQLSQQQATGGGDYPEAMEQALATAVNAKWRDGNTARLLFLVADAPPHNQNLAAMLKPIRTARQKGIRLYSLAASGVANTAEFMMRSASVLTQARYLFLTDDSGVGNPHAEPRVACYIVTRLDQLMSRVIASELAGKRIEPTDSDIIRKVGTYEAGVCK